MFMYRSALLLCVVGVDLELVNRIFVHWKTKNMKIFFAQNYPIVRKRMSDFMCVFAHIEYTVLSTFGISSNSSHLSIMATHLVEPRCV